MLSEIVQKYSNNIIMCKHKLYLLIRAGKVNKNITHLIKLTLCVKGATHVGRIDHGFLPNVYVIIFLY